MKVAFYTLGCKVNQYETNAMAQKFLEKGYQILEENDENVEEKPDVCIINTCTVTNMSDRKSRQMIRRAKEINPEAIIIAVGCYVQVAKKEIENINVFRDANVSNVTAVVGKNGTGKTTLMQYITALNDIQSSRKMEIKYPEKRYSDRKNRFLAVYLKDGESTFDIVNLTGNTIEYSGRKYENFEFERSVNESYTKNMSHIYFSNSAYINHENLNLRQNEINYITLTDAALDVLQREFYKRIYGVDDNIKKNADETPFNILENYYVSQENNQAFQSLLDVFYYLNQYKNGGEFCGKRIKEVDVSIEFSDMREDGDDEESRDKQEKMPFRDPFEDGKRMAWKIRDKMIISDFWDVLICNLVYELGASFAEFSERLFGKVEYSSNEVLYICERFINEQCMDERKRYYAHAIREIKSFGIYFKKNKVTGTLKNGFVKLDIAVFDDLQRCLQSGNSMILKYMKIQNLKMSSGERAFLNMMSRIYFSAHIREFLPDKSFQWEESILLIIDEIDLYLHPEWQRIIVSELLNIVKDQFPNNYFQIIVTSHSPIVLSDIPIENSIYLDRNADGLTRQVQRNEQTFGANIHALYQNAFFLNDGLAMGKFAQERINIWIEEAEKANPQKMKQIINMIGEPLICRELRKIIGRRQETIREKAKNEEHMMMLRFLKQQKAEIERQIKILEEEYSD